MAEFKTFHLTRPASLSPCERVCVCVCPLSFLVRLFQLDVVNTWGHARKFWRQNTGRGNGHHGGGCGCLVWSIGGLNGDDDGIGGPLNWMLNKECCG